MSSRNEECFDGDSTLLDLHGRLQVLAGNANRFNQFSTVTEGPQKRIAEELLWLNYNLSLCCVIVGDFVTYIGGIL